MSFVDYHCFEDIGFYPNELRIEMSSNFVFLTFDKKLNQTMVNVLIIDPYYKQVEIAIFQSNKCFESHKSKKF